MPSRSGGQPGNRPVVHAHDLGDRSAAFAGLEELEGLGLLVIGICAYD
jgi:hypothetical protein